MEKVPVYCYQCVAGPDLLKVSVQDDIAVNIEPNFDISDKHPACGRVCVKAYGLIQKMYNPNRVKTPYKRGNPKKGVNEDPQWIPISWDEALDIMANNLKEIRRKGHLNKEGLPRFAATLGQAGVVTAYFGTFTAFFASYGGPIDFGLGSGQGVKCFHSEHIYGELWQKGFVVSPDTPMSKYLLTFGRNDNASVGVAGVWRHAQAKERGLKRVQVEPSLSVTGATSKEWVPIRPKTDAAFLFSMIHTILYENNWRDICDLPFLKKSTNSPYLIGPNGYYLRDSKSSKPLVWDCVEDIAKEFDDPSVKDYALDGNYVVRGVEVGPDGKKYNHSETKVQPSFQLLIESVKGYTPEWASQICDVPTETIRRVVSEFLQNAAVGTDIEVDGEKLPYRPVAITLGRTVNNGWGGYQCCWSRTVLASLVGALEVPGGLIGTCVRINKPAENRIASVKPGPDGFMDFPFNTTDKEKWKPQSKSRNSYNSLIPLVGHSSWSPSLGPTHLGWQFMKKSPKNWPKSNLPDFWMVYRANPVISSWDSNDIIDTIKDIPFTAAFAYTIDETNWFADLLLPENTDLEGLQLYRIGGTKYMEQMWEHQGFALNQPVVKPSYDTMDMTEIATELASRLGMLKEYNEMINRGLVLGVKLKGPGYDFSLDPNKKYSADEIWDKICRAATRELSQGKEEHDLKWFKKHGFFLVPLSKKGWYLHNVMKNNGLRYEIPYQERIKVIGEQLKARLHGEGVHWWDEQLKEYQAIPAWEDFPKIWGEAAKLFGKDPDEYDLWFTTSRSMQYSWGANVSLPIMADVSKKVLGHTGLMMNDDTARKKGIKDGEMVWIESPIAKVEGKIELRKGIRPDVVIAPASFGQWATPFAKDIKIPNLNPLAPVHIALTDATGSGSDLVKVKVYKK